MQRMTPPFRADHVGSLLRPPAIKEARAKHARNEITAAALRAVEDREIEKAIRKQEDIGLKFATDGEFRRSWCQFDFFRELQGVKLYQVGDRHTVSRGEDQGRDALKIGSKFGFSRPIRMIEISNLSKRTRAFAENDDSGAEYAAFPAGPHRRSGNRSIPIWMRFFEDWPTRPQGDARLL